MINPMKLMQLKEMQNKFQANHPKFPMFLSAAFGSGMSEGTIIDITVTKPDGEKMQSNIRITPSDLELIEELKNITSQN